MKGFIEVTETDGNTKRLINIMLIHGVSERSYSDTTHRYGKILYSNYKLYVKESYEEIKELIKQAL